MIANSQTAYCISLFGLSYNNGKFALEKINDIGKHYDLFMVYNGKAIEWAGYEQIVSSGFIHNVTQPVIFCGMEEQYPTIEDVWSTLIMSHKGWYKTMLDPSDRLTTLHKLLWEV